MDARNDPHYVIGVVAQILSVHPQTLRLYERMGLVQPRRSRGNIRRYSEGDIERLRCIQRLVNDLGVNLAGVEVILNMREQMAELRREMEELQAAIGRNST